MFLSKLDNPSKKIRNKLHGKELHHYLPTINTELATLCAALTRPFPAAFLQPSVPADFRVDSRQPNSQQQSR